MLRDGTTIYAGTNGGVYSSNDDGASWTYQALNGSIIYALAMNGSTLYAGAYYSGVHRSTDGGVSWTFVSDNGLPTNASVRTLVTSGSDLFAGISYGGGESNGGVYVTSDNGDSWNMSSSGLPNAMVSSMAAVGTELFAASLLAQYRSSDNGASWTSLFGPCGYQVGVMTVVDNTFLMVGGLGTVCSTSDLGNTWAYSSDGLHPLVGIRAIATNSQYIFAATNGLGVWQRPVNDVISGLIETRLSEGVSVYPNPTDGRISIGSIAALGRSCHLELFDATGSKCHDQLINSDNSSFDLDLSHIAKGAYVLRANGEYGIISEKVFIQ